MICTLFCEEYKNLKMSIYLKIFVNFNPRLVCYVITNSNMIEKQNIFLSPESIFEHCLFNSVGNTKKHATDVSLYWSLRCL